MNIGKVDIFEILTQYKGPTQYLEKYLNNYEKIGKLSNNTIVQYINCFSKELLRDLVGYSLYINLVT